MDGCPGLPLQSHRARSADPWWRRCTKVARANRRPGQVGQSRRRASGRAGHERSEDAWARAADREQTTPAGGRRRCSSREPWLWGLGQMAPGGRDSAAGGVRGRSEQRRRRCWRLIVGDAAASTMIAGLSLPSVGSIALAHRRGHCRRRRWRPAAAATRTHWPPRHSEPVGQPGIGRGVRQQPVEDDHRQQHRGHAAGGADGDNLLRRVIGTPDSRPSPQPSPARGRGSRRLTSPANGGG